MHLQLITQWAATLIEDLHPKRMVLAHHDQRAPPQEDGPSTAQKLRLARTCDLLSSARELKGVGHDVACDKDGRGLKVRHIAQNEHWGSSGTPENVRNFNTVTSMCFVDIAIP